MLHQDIKLPDPLGLKNQAKLEATSKKGGVFKYPRTFQCDNG